MHPGGEFDGGIGEIPCIAEDIERLPPIGGRKTSDLTGSPVPGTCAGLLEQNTAQRCLAAPLNAARPRQMPDGFDGGFGHQGGAAGQENTTVRPETSFRDRVGDLGSMT